MDNHDAHPNERANREIGPLFVEFLDQAIQEFAPGSAAPAAPVETTAGATAAESQPTAAVAEAAAPEEKESSGGGICPVAALLPLGVAAVVAVRRR